MSFSQYSIYYIDTSQIQTVDITPVTNGIRYQCHFLLYSLLWGCGIVANNNMTSSVPQNTTTHIASSVLTNICPGKYNITIFISNNETSIDFNNIIFLTIVTVIGTNCRTMPSAGKSYSCNNTNHSILLQIKTQKRNCFHHDTFYCSCCCCYCQHCYFLFGGTKERGKV